MFIFLKFTIGFVLVPWFELDNIQSLVLCNRSLEDSDLEEVISVTKRNNIQITNSFCEKFDFTNSIIFIDNPQYGEIRELLNVPNAQLSLTSNILLIYTTKSADSLHGFFDQNQLKIGLNANIFLVLQSNLEDILYQALGTGTTYLRNLLKATKERNDFQGISIRANYGDSFKPYCWKDKVGMVHGTQRKALEIASKYLNLSLFIQDPKPENNNIWAKKLENGSFIGIIREVQDGYVDTSVAGFSATLERSEIIDFSQSVFKSVISVIIKKPRKTDISLRYFWLGNSAMIYFE